jgi:hypothetical protein
LNSNKAPRSNAISAHERQQRRIIIKGGIENRTKELHKLQIDRTSCRNFRANQIRVLLAAAAYPLMRKLRRNATHISYARAQVWILRERLLKLGGRVLDSARRVVVHQPVSLPFLSALRQVAMALGAQPGQRGLAPS